MHLEMSAPHRCSSDDCADFGMDCGAIFGLRIVDADVVSDGEGGLVPREIHAARCVRVPKATSLCGLDQVSLPMFEPVPADRKLQIQIALWSPQVLNIVDDDVVTAETCPMEGAFDLQGIPRLVPPTPAFGGSLYFTAGQTAFIDVPLACTNPPDLYAGCIGEIVNVTARVDDLETTIFVPPNHAPALDVAIAKPTEQPIDENTSEWVTLTEDIHELTLDEDSLVPAWNGAVIEDFDATACILTLDKSETQPTTSALCTDVIPNVEELPNMRGLLISEENLAQFLVAIGLTQLPSRGLVVGRVVDHIGNPLSGVRVEPLDPLATATVSYLTNDRLSTTETVTNNNGYFFSPDAAFNTAWRAEHLDGRREDGNYRAGLLAGKVSVVLIEMQPP